MINFIAIALALIGQAQPIKCPVMGGAVAANSQAVEYNGARYTFCCDGCEGNFVKVPEEFLATQRKAGNTVGTFLFDPVSRKRLDIAKAKATADFNSLRYPFESQANKDTFLKSPGKFANTPAKEALYCPVGKEAVVTYSKASDYVDHDGVRFYMCCDGCGEPFEKDPNKYLPVPDGTIRMLKASGQAHGGHHPTTLPAQRVNKVRFGKYEAELRVPEEGLFANEEVDVEFRVTDTTQKDPVEEGFKGVGGITATAIMTMPDMQGMPAAKPPVHREGIPGDYGIVLYFPHGGEYQIDLSLTIPGDGTKKITFMVDVKDERPATTTKAKPYKLQVVEAPKAASQGKASLLKLRVIDSKTGQVQKKFEVVHEMKFHLLIASKDLNWFLHEHPTMAADGTWSVPIRFPAGGDYWVYGDVAPVGKGSQILITKVSLKGPKPTWNTKLNPSKTSTDGGLKGELSIIDGKIPIGRMTTLQVKLTDTKSGIAAGDTVPWLGAAGHMMIFHTDGQTVVHSHPKEDAENAALVKKGIVRFTGRFPKPGMYKVYAQFDWHGKIRTLNFAIEVKA